MEVQWNKMGVLVSDIQVTEHLVEQQVGALLKKSAKDDSVPVEVFDKAFDNYTQGVVTTLKGIESLQEGARKLHTAFDILYDANNKEGRIEDYVK